MRTQHTPGPWRWEYNAEHKNVELVGGRPQFDLTVVDFVRWGLGGAVPRFRDDPRSRGGLMFPLCKRTDWLEPFPNREHHKSWCQSVTHPDATLIESAPDLLAALMALVKADPKISNATDADLRAALSDDDEEVRAQAAAFIAARAAIAKATGSEA